MFKILITVHPSKRFPEKNKFLFKYTEEYLDSQLRFLNVINSQIYTIGYKSEIPDSIYNHIEYHKDSHKDVVKYFALNYCNANDVIILMQLTQPVRSENLLYDAMIHHLSSDVPLFSKCLENDEIDGSLYSALAKNSDDIFNHELKHDFVTNKIPKKIDIDYKEQYDEFLNNLSDKS